MGFRKDVMVRSKGTDQARPWRMTWEDGMKWMIEAAQKGPKGIAGRLVLSEA